VVAEAFDRACRRGRLAHAYFFVGPAGVGKRRFAGELAKALLCEARADGGLEACDQCPACQRVEADSHPDCFVAGRPPEKTNLPIEVVRELCRKLSLKPVRGRGKVAILDDADDLNDPITQQAAANAFLKTLEEPPPGSVLILVGTSIDQQLPTIVSRCQVVRFDPLPDEMVAEVLRESGVEEAATLRRAVRLGAGSPGQALALAEADFWEFRKVLVAALGHGPFDSVGLARTWMKFVEGAGKELVAQRQRAALALRLLIDVLREALAGRPGDPDDRPALEAVARAGPEVVLELLERCLEADRQIDRRVQLVLVIEALLDSLGQKLRAAS
jgi:DNA polymerase-3 subunit delta'